MKKYFYAFGTAALALNVSGLPAMPTLPGGAPVALPVQLGNGHASPTRVKVGNVQVDTDEEGRTNVQVGNVQVQTDKQGSANVRVGDIEVSADDEDNSVTLGDMRFDLEDFTDTAISFDGLAKSIEQRKQELEQEVESVTPQNKDILENVNQVRLAVHALLASKDLLGGIGTQVSQIAQQMNDSVATTTNAEEKIQSRGFFSSLFFGGDSAAANTISQAVTKNQGNVQKLTELLSQTNVPADIQTTLKAQITALQAEQARLQALAKKEKSRWGIFSWRFF